MENQAQRVKRNRSKQVKARKAVQARITLAQNGQLIEPRYIARGVFIAATPLLRTYSPNIFGKGTEREDRFHVPSLATVSKLTFIFEQEISVVIKMRFFTRANITTTQYAINASATHYQLPLSIPRFCFIPDIEKVEIVLEFDDSPSATLFFQARHY